MLEVILQRIYYEIMCNLCVGYGLETFGDFFKKVTSWKQEEGRDISQHKKYKMLLSHVERSGESDI